MVSFLVAVAVIPWLLSQLSQAGRLTEDTLVKLSGNLLREMRKSAKICEKFVQLGGVEVLEKVLRGDPESATQMLTPFHPELQAVLSLILAEVILLSDAEVMAKRGARKMAMNFFLSNRGDLNQRMGALAKLSKHSAQSDRAVETLFNALDGAMRRHEHALVWSVLNSLSILVSSASCCQMLFTAGFIPLLHRVLEVYTAFTGILPKALARRDEKLKSMTQTAPEFVSTFKPSAIQKNPETLKEWWLKKSVSLPELPETGSAPRRPSMAWLSESRSSKETSGHSPGISKASSEAKAWVSWTEACNQSMLQAASATSTVASSALEVAAAFFVVVTNARPLGGREAAPVTMVGAAAAATKEEAGAATVWVRAWTLALRKLAGVSPRGAERVFCEAEWTRMTSEKTFPTAGEYEIELRGGDGSQEKLSQQRLQRCLGSGSRAMGEARPRTDMIPQGSSDLPARLGHPECPTAIAVACWHPNWAEKVRPPVGSLYFETR
eukprot:s42_g5.t1